jgi:hypothetical protein
MDAVKFKQYLAQQAQQENFVNRDTHGISGLKAEYDHLIGWKKKKAAPVHKLWADVADPSMLSGNRLQAKPKTVMARATDTVNSLINDDELAP